MKGHAQRIAVSHVPATDVQVLAKRKTSSGSVNKIMLFKCPHKIFALYTWHCSHQYM